MFQPIKLSSLTLESPVFAAPLAGITDRPFRKILRKCAPKAPLLTEMISCHSLVQQHKNCHRNFDRYEDEGQIGAQIFGAEPTIIAEAAKILESQGASWIDINMGCPVPKVATKAGAGAFLMRDHKLAGNIIEAVARSVRIPVSIKTRLGWDEQHLDSDNLLRVAAESGAQFATLHGRTRAQGYSGVAKLPDIDGRWGAFLRKAPKAGFGETRPTLIPIIANGDIKTAEDLARVEKLGYAGAMIGRGLLGRPWLLGECGVRSVKCEVKSENNSTLHTSHSTLISEHFDLVLEYYGPRAGVPLFRKHAAWYSAGMTGSAEFRTKVNQITDAREMHKIINEFFVAK